MAGMLYIAPDDVLAPEPLPGGAAVLVREGRIVGVGAAGELPCPPGAQVVSGEGLLLAPGFIDLQLNGGFGFDFTERPASIWDVGAQLPRYGVTAFLPTIISAPLAVVREAQRVLLAGPPNGYRGATPLGLHLEGPFLNPKKRGAHNPAHMRLPDLESIEGWSPERGVLMVTLAPELPGAIEVIKALAERGVLVSAGHSAATWAEANAGVEAGARYGTHLFNAMSPLDHREPGLPGALLASEAVTVGVIADGVHLHPSVVSLAWRAKGAAKVSLVTDAMAALGMPPGTYRLGDNDVTVDGCSARLDDGTLAGSLLSLDAAVRNAVAFTGCSLHEAISCVTSVPADLLALDQSRGRIAEGCVADMVLLTPELQTAATIIGGEVVYTSGAQPLSPKGSPWPS